MGSTDTPEASGSAAPAAAVGDGSAEAFAERLFSAAVAAFELTAMDLGLRLGLYQRLRGVSMTAAGLAQLSGVDRRYAREWLEQQAVAGIVVCDDVAAMPEERRYGLPETHARCLLDVEDPLYMAPFVAFPRLLSDPLPELVSAYRSGAGLPYAHYQLHEAQGAQNRPALANDLGGWLAAVPGLPARLRRPGARIAEIGCGVGWACIYSAEAFSEASVDGYDLDGASVAEARRNAADRGLGDRVRFAEIDVAQLGTIAEPLDLVFAVEMVHDLSRPVQALAAMRRLAGADGVVMVVDEHVRDRFEAPADELERVFYAFSVLHCLPVGLVEQPSAATGTVLRPATLRGYAEEAGFTAVEELDIGSDFFRGYRLVQ